MPILAEAQPAEHAVAPLWPHQQEALDFALTRPASLLGLPMGSRSGKSRVAVETADRDHAMRVLIAAPKSVLGVWPSQFAQYSTRNWLVWNGTVMGARGPKASPTVAERARAIEQAIGQAAIEQRPVAIAVNHEAIWQPAMLKVLLHAGFTLLIADESHRWKSPSGKASKAGERLAAKTRHGGGRVLLLTGTPMPHTPLDLFAQVRALDGGQRLGKSYHRFCHEYAEGEPIWAPGGIQRTKWTGIRPDKAAEFAQKVAPILFQVDRQALDDTLGLPDAFDTTRTCTLEPKARRAYEQLEADLIADVDGGVITASNRMVLTTRLAQLSGGHARTPDGTMVQVGAEKEQLLADVLADLPAREPVVVFARFRADLDAIQRAAGHLGRAYAELSGRRRDALAPDSTLAPDVQVAGVQLQSGGVGVDFTAARTAIYYSLDFSLADHDQSRKRLHRPGQHRTVTYAYLIAENTIDRAVLGALRKRQDAVQAALEHIRTGAHPHHQARAA